MAAAAALLKVPITTVRGAKRAGAPCFRSGRVFVNELREWLADNEVAAAPADVRTRYFLAKAQREELRLARERRETLPREEVQRVLNASMAQLFASLDRIFATELPGRAKGMNEQQIRAIAVSDIESLKKHLREQWGALTTDQPKS